MEINKNVTLYADAKLVDGGIEKVVANFVGNISNSKLNYNIGVNIINKPLIDLNETNQALYQQQYDEFEQAVKDNLV
jgi:hypothetical protein